MKSNSIFTTFSILAAFVAVFTSCATGAIEVEAPPFIRQQAYEHAVQFLGMDYEWGGQDFPSSRGIDCSGLVVNAYYLATQGTNYELLFSDAAVVDLLNHFSIPVVSPEKGDLIFMGDGEITHVAILETIEDGVVYFVDAYSEAGSVQLRSYETTSPKIFGYGRLKLLMHV